MKLSLRWRILFSIALINAFVFGIGLVFLAKDFETERMRTAEQRNQVIASLVVPAIDPLGEIAVTPILRSSAWREFEDVLIVRDRFKTDEHGKVEPFGAWLNPLGRIGRTARFDEQAILRDVRDAVQTRRSVASHGGFAIPIVDTGNQVWGGCWFLPPRESGVGTVVARLLPWFLLSTLLLTLGTFHTLRRFVLDPVESLAQGAQRLAGGDLSTRVTARTRGGEIHELIDTFNAMAVKVEGYNAELARDVEIATQKVRQAESAAMTQRRLAATGELAAGIAHEINNPLGGLLNAVEALQRQELPPAKRDQYHALLKGGLERIQATVGKLLRFTPRTSKPVPLALVDPVSDALALVQHRARELGVVMRLQGAPAGDERTVEALHAMPPVMGQANEIGQAVLNLLVNALDALESLPEKPAAGVARGHVDVRLEARGGEIALIVADDGPGVAPQELARVADLFYTTKDVGKGTGLGLSIVHGVVSSHGGRVQLSSEPGRGFQVVVLLPDLARTGGFADMNGNEALSLLALPVLICTSAFCSGSETALFSLDERARAAAGPRVQKLLAEPQALLVTLLLTNLIVNILFFAFAGNLTPPDAAYGGIVYGMAAVFVLVLCGEHLPKTLALRAGPAFARFVARPLVPLVALLTLPRRVVQFMLEIAVRALGEVARPEEGITADALYEVLEHSAKGGLIASSEADLLSEVVELEGIRVREITTPRVDMLTIDLEDEDEEHRWFVIARALAKRLTWLPVVRGSPDAIVGQVRMRDVLAQPDERVEDLIQPVHFIPEVASVLDLLHSLRASKATEAIVVDEYGGTTGYVTIEHVFEEIVGDLRVEGETSEAPVVRLQDGRFRVAGDLSIRDWNERFGREIVPAGFETVGGLVMALLGRIPRTGDTVRLAGIDLRVHDVRGRRVSSIDMSVQSREPRGATA